MPLVDYGSSDDEQSAAEVAQPATRGTGLNLPAPSNGGAAKKSGLSLPEPSNRKRGPVQIAIGATPTAELDEEAERAKKRARTMLSGSRSGLTGLASMLPAPKSTAAPPVAVTTASDADDAERAAMRSMLEPAPTAFVPKSTQSKAKPASTNDFFSLGSSSQASRSNGESSSSVSFSAAPVLAEPEPEPPKPNYYSTMPPPSLDNPYPGFHALPSGDWAADDPEAWQEWIKLNGWDKAPQEKIEGVTDVKGREGAEETKKDVKPGRVAPEDNREAPNIRKSQNQLAKGRHQLSHMLHSAYENRAELEDRIAAAKANRRTSAMK